ncbi:two-component regulator propeller domain-containing protein [Dysgonomonas sp. HGC4]|uniref:hybrid sensor histidine kinase/response regulator transcription factor n=1 Tax=Dysgonomonas sp. HGC4 TaxID=1658009 RepID=UPI00067FE1F8|nr:two-component regulator propeller domain-containing protein [Dysgonomonas sp. HGC4]MBD8348838.1 response regulator [Dysgonomonas sp. HGC4]
MEKLLKIFPFKYFIGVLFVTLSLPMHATNVVKYLSNINGLSNNSVNCIFEDSEHTVWIGTWDGLNAYNGRDIKTFRYNKNNKHSISNNIIRQIVEQDASYLWVSTDYGVNRWDRKTQTFTNYFFGPDHKVPKQEKSFMLGLTSSRKVVSFVKEQGLFYFDDQAQLFKAIDIQIKGEIKDFLIDNNDNAYFLLNNGTLKYYKVKQTGDNVISFNNEKEVKSDSFIDRIFFSENKLILTSSNGLSILNESLSLIKHLDFNLSKSISQAVYHKDILYISFYEGGCIKYDQKEDKLTDVEGVSDRVPIFTMYFGNQDILWIGSDGQGVLQVYKYASPFQTVKTNHPVRSFCQNADGEILIGTKGDGIKLLNRETGFVSDYKNLSNGLISNSVYSIKKNKLNDIFIGTEGEGINILHAKNNRLQKLNIPSRFPIFKAIYSIYFSNNDSLLWLGTSGYGLIRIKLNKVNDEYVVEDLEQYISSDQRKSLSNDVIYTIIPSSNKNELWFGTRGAGLNKVNTKNGTFENFEDVHSDLPLTNNDILCLLSSSDQNLWIGTSYGLNRLETESNPKQIFQYTENEGLNNNTIHGILEDNSNNIWISTNQGISRLDSSSGKIANYTLMDGLQNDEFSDGAYLKDKDNNLYFGGVSGFSYFNPDNIQLRNFDPILSLSSLKIYNTSQNINERIKDGVLQLSYDERYVTFSFIASDFINNENCEYAYRLSNYTEGWINNGNNPNIVFAKLPPGKYKLEVRTTNGDKVWSKNMYELQISVAHPWWLSTIAILLYVLLALIALYVTQSVIKNRIRLNRELFLKKIEKEHQQKVYESKLNLFTNVAHEFFTPLTLIYGPAQHLLESVKLDSYTKRYIQIIKNNAERMQKLINELMEFRKTKTGHTPLHPETIDVKLLTDYVSDNYIEMAQENKIDYQVAVNNTSTINTDRDSLEKIFFNLFSNAFKYTPRNGYIHINVWQDAEHENALHMTVRNSGKGLTESQMAEIFNKYKIFDDTPKVQSAVSTGIGLNLTKGLTELLGGKITVSSKYGESVQFTLVVPPLLMVKPNVVSEESNVVPQSNYLLNIQSNKKVSILIVEDEKNITELLKDILTPYYTTQEAVDGEDALNQIEINRPDIIISDIMMPNLDGITLIDRLKSNPKTAHIPIISISAKNTIEDHINAYKHGADLYISKPFHPRHVLSTIENLINKQATLKEYFNSSISSEVVRDGITMHQEGEKFLEDIISFIENSMDDESLNPNSIADFLGISKATLYRKLKELTDKTPSEFVRTIRLAHASKLLKSTRLTVSEIMFKSGFTNKSYFYREFAKQYEMSPKEYRDANDTPN